MTQFFDDAAKDRIKAAIKAKQAHKRKYRPQRIERIAKKLTVRAEKRFDRLVIEGQKKGRKPFTKKPLPAKPRLKPFVAYDLETTRIKKGTPQPLYITAYSNEFSYSGRVSSIQSLAQTLIDNFLLPEHNGFRFVAWNGNRFDVYFIAAALLHHSEYILRPYLTRTKNLRGLKVMLRNPEGDDKKPLASWEFLDGMSMTGIQKPLADFLKVFAPDYGKLKAPDWEKEEFDYKNKNHVEYAERDSEGLYHALVAAQNIITENFGTGLKPTIGNMGIRIFQSEMPDGVRVFFPPYSVVNDIRNYAMRGGFCFCVRKYEGPIWKYDINQAYAAAMRESWLPAGRCYATPKGPSKYANCAVYRIRASNPKNTVPFYYRDIETGKSQFGINEIRETWITSIEYDQLKREKWSIEFIDGYAWETAFRMDAYVNKLEHLRINGPGGPKSAQGEMIKAVGNNSYGKTVERLEGMELVMAKEPPEGWYPYQAEDDLLQHLWFKFNEPQTRDYHQPQIGAFITAHVRMVLRLAIMVNPEGWLYADTDCVAFDSPVDLPLSATQYGYWKQETDGEHYRIIAKKVYASIGAKEKHAKGLNIKRLTDADFEAWFNGTVPVQEQTQRQNFVAVMAGFDMFIERTRRGTMA